MLDVTSWINNSEKWLRLGPCLLNKQRKDNSAGNLFAYKRQKNVCVKLLGKSKKNFYNYLNVKRITDNRTFWQTIKPN